MELICTGSFGFGDITSLPVHLGPHVLLDVPMSRMNGPTPQVKSNVTTCQLSPTTTLTLTSGYSPIFIFSPTTYFRMSPPKVWKRRAGRELKVAQAALSLPITPPPTDVSE